MASKEVIRFKASLLEIVTRRDNRCFCRKQPTIFTNQRLLVCMRALLIILITGLVSIQSFSQMVLSGTATGDCDCYELTDGTNQAGSVWSPGTIDLTNSFDFSFEVNLGDEDVWGADGMVFALRQSGTTTGAIGRGMGYRTITNSVGVEIDTWNSSPTVATDIDSDHLGMNSNGVVDHDLIAPVAIANIEDGTFHTFRVTWDPVGFDLEVYLDGSSEFVYNGDMVTLFFGGNPDVYFGWTGGTGGVGNTQSVCMYRDADFTSDYTTACVDQLITFTDDSESDLIYDTDEAVTWAWTFGDGGTSALENPTHTYLATGTYTVTLTITDVSGCSSTTTSDIVITEGLDLDMTHTDITCFGDDDGTGTATPLTGTGPYLYLWDDPMAQTDATATDLGPNTYDVIVTDALGCTGSGTVTVVEPPELVIDSSVPTNASCGMSNGTIMITASGGTPALEYSIDGGVTFFPTGSFIGLTNTSYDIVVRDANGCTATTTTIVGLDSPLFIDDVVITEVTCGPGDDGTITIIPSDGVGPYIYSVDGGVTYQPMDFFDLLPAGPYTVMVLDAAGCTVSMDVVVGSASTVVIDMITVTDATCNGGTDGEIDILASGGTGPYEYSIDGGVTFFPTTTFTGLGGGPYDIEVLDAAGCTAVDMAAISEPTAIVLDAVATTDVSCNGLMDGEFELTVSGGTPGYEYSNDAGGTFQVSPIFDGLAGGTYDLVIRDVSGCTLASTTDIVDPTPLLIDAVLVTDVTCNGLMDGEITVTASGGTTPYEYRIDAGAYQVSPTFLGLGGGAMTVEVSDVNGCTVTEDIFLNEADPILLALDPDTTICLGGMANLCPTTSGGTAPYTYLWDGIPSAICLDTDVLGAHTLEIIDVNGCTSELETQSILQYLPLSVLATPSASICPGDDIVIAGEADGEGPDPTFTYEWTNDVDATVLIGPSHTVNPTVTTTYTLTVSRGCENTASTTVTISIYPVPDVLVGTTDGIYAGCQEFEVDLVSYMDPTVVSTINWDFGDGSIGAGPAVNHTYIDADCYDVIVDIETVDGCSATATFLEFICAWEMPIADFSYSPEQPNIFLSTVSFENKSENASSYLWTFGDGGGGGEINPEHTYPEIGNRSYEVELTATSDDGCEHSTAQWITIDEIVLYYIPNAFTPNSDPFNQMFTPVFIPGFFPTDFHFILYNRWGEVVWESYDQTAGWDGTYDGQFVDNGVYAWSLTFRENKTDKKYSDFGHVTLLK